MLTTTNQAAWLHKAGEPLRVSEAPIPEAGNREIVVKNAAVAVNPLDCHMQDSGVFVQQWPTVFGCDVAGIVHQVGPDVTRFKPGDRVIGHCINLVTGRPSDGAYAAFTVVPEDKAAILPDDIPFTEGVVVPFALEAAACALFVQEPGPCMPGVLTPALGLPYPSLDGNGAPTNKCLVVYGASSSAGSMTTQIARAAGIHVVAIAGAHNFAMLKRCGAAEVFDHRDAAVVQAVIEAVKRSGKDFVGIFDAISTPETYSRDVEILTELGCGHLACVHPPPAENIPANIKAGMIFAVNDVAAPLFRDFLTPALRDRIVKCLPSPTVIGKGLEHVDDALKKCKAGVSATKLVIEL